MSNWMSRWGMRPLSECVGKTIEKVEGLPMDYHSTFPSALLVLFTDGTRAWVAGSDGHPNIMPSITEEAAQHSTIVRPEEAAQMIEARVRREQRSKHEQEVRKRQEYERLKKEFGDT